MDQKIITYDEELSKFKSVIEKDSLTEDEQYYLSLFAMDLCHRQLLYNNDLASKEMQNNLQKTIQLLQTTPETKAKAYFTNNYNQHYVQEVQNNSQSQSQSNSLSHEKAYVRVRTDGIHTANISEDDYTPNNNSGFSNTLLILITTATSGIILALLLIYYLSVY